MSLDTSHCADCNVEFPGSWAMFGPAHAPVCWTCWEKRERDRRRPPQGDVAINRAIADFFRATPMFDVDAQEAAL